MTDGSPMRVLLAISSSPDSTHAVREAIRLLPLRQAAVYLVAVTDTVTPRTSHEAAAGAVRLLLQQELEQSRQQLEVARLLLAQMDIHATPLEREGEAGHEILAMARELAIDAIVLGSRGGNALERWVLGSVSEHVLHHFAGAVLIVRAEGA